MPKETTHMVLAQQVFRALPKDSVFHAPVKRCLNLFIYGSVAPDSCFYHVIGPHSSLVQEAGQIFHEPDASSLLPVLGFLERFYGTEPDALAFAAGLCSHIMTDTVFHPMVYYFAGMDNLHEGATARHRMFETALDLHVRSMTAHGEKIFLHKVLAGLEVPDERVTCFLKNLFCSGNRKCRSRLIYALKFHGIAHRLFSNYTFYKCLRTFSGYRIGVPEIYETLFYPCDRPLRFRFFDRIPDYKDPATGVKGAGSVKELMQKAVEKTLLLLSVIERAIGEKGEGERVKQSGQGQAVLDPGTVMNDPDLPGIKPCPPHQAEQFRYWHGPSDLRQWLYKDTGS